MPGSALSQGVCRVGGYRERAPLLLGLAIGVGGYALARLLPF